MVAERAVAGRVGGGEEQGSYYRTLYHRHKSRGGSKKAVVVVQHAILTAIWHMLSRGVLHEDLGPDHFRSRDKERRVRSLVKQLKKLGAEVSLREAVA